MPGSASREPVTMDLRSAHLERWDKTEFHRAASSSLGSNLAKGAALVVLSKVLFNNRGRRR